jgi:signal recognition particle subunit SRP72
MFSGAKPGADADGPDAQISDLFGRLASACEDQSHKRALKVCEDLLKLTPGDFDASHAKVVALIELGRCADAVAFLEEGDAQLRVKLSFELAYALYRSNRLTDALAKLDEIGNGDGDDEQSKKYAALQLKAQLLYRVGRSGESVSLYNDLFTRFPTKTKECSSSAVNLTAALVAAGCSDKILQALKKIGTTPKASFELAFNVACGLLVSGEFHDATQYLQLAKTLGESTLHDEGLSGDEIKHELAPIDAQLAFCEAELGRTELATDLYKKVLSLNGSDAATNAVCVTNLAVLVGPRGEGGTELMKKVEKLTDGEGNVSQNVSTLSSIAATKKALVHNRAVCQLLNLLHELRTALASRAHQDR